MLHTNTQIEQTVENLFRHEWGKLVAVLTKLFGPQNLQMAEDVVQDTLLKAFNSWKINGVPQNPSAWLFTVARNKAVDVLRQQKRHSEFSKSITPLLQSEYTLVPLVKEIINTDTIDDDQLRMMLVCCHPCLSAEAQVSLILKTLCGFNVAEIAKAFVTGYDTIEKRLYRARQSFRDSKVQFELPAAAELDKRLDNVLIAIYLLFNEGYNSTQHKDLIRNDLINEAMRLCELICRNPLIKNTGTHALMALICFAAARNDARLDTDGNILLLKDQDRRRWNKPLIEKGVFHLEASSAGESISKYHFEAGIAYEHAKAGTYATTDWQNILQCYNLLQQYFPSPVVELNRAIVISELQGAAEGIKAIESISQLSSLKKYYLLPATLGELHLQLHLYDKAKAYLAEAIALTQSATEKKLLQQKLDAAGK
jgi:RNA polymerase sigma factor (sigma-70 family)